MTHPDLVLDGVKCPLCLKSDPPLWTMTWALTDHGWAHSHCAERLRQVRCARAVWTAWDAQQSRKTGIRRALFLRLRPEPALSEWEGTLPGAGY